MTCTLFQALGELNFQKPTPIQAATVPIALMGKDLCACAATGTGKSDNDIPAIPLFTYTINT